MMPIQHERRVRHPKAVDANAERPTPIHPSGMEVGPDKEPCGNHRNQQHHHRHHPLHPLSNGLLHLLLPEGPRPGPDHVKVHRLVAPSRGLHPDRCQRIFRPRSRPRRPRVPPRKRLPLRSRRLESGHIQPRPIEQRIPNNRLLRLWRFIALRRHGFEPRQPPMYVHLDRNFPRNTRLRVRRPNSPVERKDQPLHIHGTLPIPEKHRPWP